MTYFKKSLALLTVTALVIITLFSTLTAYASEPLGESKTEESVNTEIFTTEKDKEESENTRNLPETDPIEDGAVYRIKNLQTGRYLTLEPNANGVYDATLNNIGTANYNGSSAQEFRIEDNFGTYYIRAIKSGNGTNRLVDVYSSNINQIVDGANVHLHPPGDENSSQWLIEYNSTLGSYVIKIACKPNLALTDVAIEGEEDEPCRNNAQINSFSMVDTAQYWIFERITESIPNIKSGDTFRIRDLNSGLYLSVSGNDADLSNVELATGSIALLNQQFRIVYDEANEMYYIKAVMSSYGYNRVLDIYSNPNSLPVNGRNVHIYVIELFENYNSCGWQIKKLGTDENGNEIVKIVSDYNNNLALTAANGGAAAGTNVRVNTDTNYDHQRWVIEKHQSGIYNVPTQGSFDIGETAQLTIPPFITNPVWVSSNPDVATVSNTGIVTALSLGNSRIYAYDATGTVIEANCKITVGTKIGELTIYAAPSHVFNEPRSYGHVFIAFKNTTSGNLDFGIIEVAENEQSTIGTYRDSVNNQRNGVWYNKDSYAYNYGENNADIEELVSLTIDITLADLDLINSYILANDNWSFKFTCASFATGLWNTVSNTTLESSIAPDIIVSRIKGCSGYEVGKWMQNVNYYGYSYNNTLTITWSTGG